MNNFSLDNGRETAFKRARNIREYLDKGGEMKTLLEGIYCHVQADAVQPAIRFVRTVASLTMRDIDEMERY